MTANDSWAMRERREHNELTAARATLSGEQGTGMDFATAYATLFGVSLRERVADLVARYRDRALEPGAVNWELDAYGLSLASVTRNSAVFLHYDLSHAGTYEACTTCASSI